MKIKKLIHTVLTSILVLINYGFQVPESQEYSLKAAFLYRFLDYIELENKAAVTENEEFNIAVLGESGIYNPLVEISKAKKTGRKSINVRQLNNLNDLGSAQIIFVSNNYKFPVKTVIDKIGHRPALIVTEQKGNLEKGSHINFLIEDNKLKFEVNLKTASHSGFKISSQLLQHALVIKK